MMRLKLAALVCAATVSAAATATEVSEPTLIYVNPKTTSFWHTATNSTITLPVDFPEGATRASLVVEGVRYRRSYDDIAAAEFALALPAPTSPETENVYDLTLTFDDDARTVRRAKLGFVESFSPGNEGVTRLRAPCAGEIWRRAVLPIPCGTTSFTVNGVETDTGLGGDQGWYALRGRNGETYSLSILVGGTDYSASLTGNSDGVFFVVK